MTELADFESERIEGYVRSDLGGGYFSVSLFSEIEPGLWMGGTPGPMGQLPDGVDYVVNVYGNTYLHRPGVEYLECALYDVGEIPAEAELTMLRQAVTGAREDGKTVLVHCQAGLNRSGLITALHLIEDKGMAPADAIALLREKRCDMVLCNKAFEAHLLESK